MSPISQAFKKKHRKTLKETSRKQKKTNEPEENISRKPKEIVKQTYESVYSEVPVTHAVRVLFRGKMLHVHFVFVHFAS